MNRQIQIKICGVTTIEDAQACAALGADLIGLIFFPQSPRVTKMEIARQIVQALPPRVRSVGVFVDARANQIRDTAQRTGISCVQLHGEASPELCRDLADEFHVIRAFGASRNFRPETAASFTKCDALLDASHPLLYGGTGQTCDWSTARATLPFTRFLILSGGLNAANVSAAIESVGPHAVDVCSGVESAPGVKNHEAVRKFIATVRG